MNVPYVEEIIYALNVVRLDIDLPIILAGRCYKDGGHLLEELASSWQDGVCL